MKLILRINDGSDGILALRAARHLIDNPEKPDAILQYGGDGGPTVWVRRNKASITAYELPAPAVAPPATVDNGGAGQSGSVPFLHSAMDNDGAQQRVG